MFEQQKKMKAKVTHIYNRLNNSEDPSYTKVVKKQNEKLSPPDKMVACF